MTNKLAKKEMTRAERKAYKAAQREGRQNFYVFVTRAEPKNTKVSTNHTKLVSRAKANRMVHGTWNPMLQMVEAPKLKHVYVIKEVK